MRNDRVVVRMTPAQLMRLYDRHIAHAERLRRQLVSGLINRREYFAARAVMRAKFEKELPNG